MNEQEMILKVLEYLKHYSVMENDINDNLKRGNICIIRQTEGLFNNRFITQCGAVLSKKDFRPLNISDVNNAHRHSMYSNLMMDTMTILNFTIGDITIATSFNSNNRLLKIVYDHSF